MSQAFQKQNFVEKTKLIPPSFIAGSKEKRKLKFIPLTSENILPNTDYKRGKTINKIILKTKSGVLLKLPNTIHVQWLSTLLRELA